MKQRIKLLSATLAGMGIPGVGEIHMLTRSGAYEPYSYWTDLVDPDRDHTDLVTAESLMTTGRNDVLLISPDNHQQTASLTWDLNMAHMVGMCAPAMMNQRTRIGQYANYTPMVTVSGYGNSFHNIYTMWGADDAGNLIGWHNTGSRNNFFNCHFAGPMNASQAIDTAACFHNHGQEAYFKRCVFGTDTVERAAGCTSLLLGGIQRTVFEKCIFLASSDSGNDAYIIEAAADTYGWAYFDKCKFINLSGSGFTNAMAVPLISAASSTAFRFLFSADTTFHGCTDVIAHGDEAKVEFGMVKSAAAAATANDIYIGLGINPDHTA